MKKILFAIAIVLTIGLTANAQSKNDAFFTDWSNDGFGDRTDIISILPAIPGGGLGIDGNESAPLGSGLLVLTALGAGYAVAKKRKK